MDEHGAVVFGGNGYSSEWHQTAADRGLPNLPTCADALPVLKHKDIEELFSRTGVLTPVELASRFEVYAEQYIRTLEVEAKLAISMAKTMVYPAAMSYLSSLTDTLTKLSSLKIAASTEAASKISELTNSLMLSATKLADALGKHDFESTEEHLRYSAKTIKPMMEDVRKQVDALEAEVGDGYWPLPTYQEMLFIK
jgi:glutamine synthetase